MEKTILLGEQPIRVKTHAATPIYYKQQFKRDYFADLMKIAKALGSLGTDKESDDSEETSEEQALDLAQVSWDDLDHLDLTVMYDVVWVFAKSADKAIPDPVTWLEGFDVFPLEELIPQVVELIQHSIKTKKK